MAPVPVPPNACPQPLPPHTHPCRPRSLADDPVLSYISTHLASLRRQCSVRRPPSLITAQSNSGPTAREASSTSGGSRAASITAGPLAEWEVQFEELRFERPCGAGSFGAVRGGREDVWDCTGWLGRGNSLIIKACSEHA